MTTAEVALTLSISPAHVRGIAGRRGWSVGDGETWARDDVDAELAGRDNHDGFSHAGAEKLAARIRTYWLKRGQTVEVWVEPAGEYVNALRSACWYVVRSNLINGRPRK